MNTHPNLHTELLLTKDEKRILRERVFRYVHSDMSQKEISRFSFHTPEKHISPFYILKRVGNFMSVFFLIALSGASFSAAYALPGDILYPFKIAQEDLDTRMVSKPSDKILIQKKHLEKRFAEADTLSKKDSVSFLSLESKADLEKHITSQVEDIQQTAHAILESDPAIAKEAISDISISLAERQIKEIEADTEKSIVRTVISPSKIEPLILSLQKTSESFSDTVTKNSKEKEGVK
jgi:hypothetical protein